MARITSHSAGVTSRTPRGRVSKPAIHRPTAEGLQNGPLAEILVLNDRKMLKYERNGHALVHQMLPDPIMQSLKSELHAITTSQKLDALRHRVRVLCKAVDPMSIQSESQALQVLRKHASDELGFLQFFNSHRTSKVIRELAFSPLMACTAAQLMGVTRVRIYQDAVFLKEPGFAETNWHSDLRMAPFDTNQFVTAWIPLRDIKGGERDSGLMFANGSHRDFALPFWRDMRKKDLADRGYEIVSQGSMALGDVSWHHGWTLHCAAPQPPGTPPRLALSISYFADGARLLPVKTDPSVFKHMRHSEDRESYEKWVSELKDGAVANHVLTPLVYVA